MPNALMAPWNPSPTLLLCAAASGILARVPDDPRAVPVSPEAPYSMTCPGCGMGVGFDDHVGEMVFDVQALPDGRYIISVVPTLSSTSSGPPATVLHECRLPGEGGSAVPARPPKSPPPRIRSDEFDR